MRTDSVNLRSDVGTPGLILESTQREHKAPAYSLLAAELFLAGSGATMICACEAVSGPKQHCLVYR